MSSEVIAIIVLGILIIGVNAFLIFFLTKKKEEPKKEDGTNILILNQMNELSKIVHNQMRETEKSVTEGMSSQFKESQHLVDKFLKELTSMTEKVTRVEETGKQMVNFAEQLQSLQDILKNPKQRGILGEYYLETLLKNVLPPGSFQMQYAFKDETIVDAVVFVKDKIIPIDSKFSLENYNRLAEERDPERKKQLEKIFVGDLKNRIVETSKYIKPGEGTLDFAFMFIPHEAIYYDLLVNKIGLVEEDTENLIQRAAGKYHVMIVSPTSFLAYLQTVLQGLKALQIEEQAKDIIKKVGDLTGHLKMYSEHHGKLGKSISTVVTQFNETSRQFKMIDKDIVRISDKELTLGFETLVIDKPQQEE